MRHVSARLHAFYNGLFQPKPRQLAHLAFENAESKLEAEGLLSEDARQSMARQLMREALSSMDVAVPDVMQQAAKHFALSVFEHEELFVLPAFAWNENHGIAEYWALQENLARLQSQLADLDQTKQLIGQLFFNVMRPLLEALPQSTADEDERAIVVPTDIIHAISQLPSVVNDMVTAWFDNDLVKSGLFDRHRIRLETNVVLASGGNPNDPKGLARAPKMPGQSDISSPKQLIGTYLGSTPALNLFRQTIDFAIPEHVRFEHQHIVAGSGHGKTQTLQYLISEDLKAVAEGKRSVIVIDSQGDLIRRISHLKLFASGEPLHDRLVLIDPTDVEWPVSLNLFDVGLNRLEGYSKLERERLTNSILELYDFVLGSLLSAEMTQKQNVIFRYVTRLMLHIPDATIHTLRDLMEPRSELKFAAHIETLTGSAKEFFRTEFGSSEFTQTRKQVLRRLWGILENQTFERMFSHPRSKLDLFGEMNAGKVILINTAKDLLKETGTEIFGRFFIALIAQAAQERATLKERDRMPTMVYIDEAADYFDRNVGIILSQARKYNVGIVLAHQYLGQLDPKLQDAISANTSIKFAGGVSSKDSRALAPMMTATSELIESQPKGSFVAFIRGVTKSALPLAFPLGHMEAMPTMSAAEFEELRAKMRDAYAVPHEYLREASDEADGEPHDEARNVNNADQTSEIGETNIDDRKPHRTAPKQPSQQSRTRSNLYDSTTESTKSTPGKSIEKSEDDASSDW